MIENKLEKCGFNLLLLMTFTSTISIGANTTALYATLLVTIALYVKKTFAVSIDKGLARAILLFLGALVVSATFSYDPVFSFNRVIAVTTRFLPLVLAIIFVRDNIRLFSVVIALSASLLVSDLAAFKEILRGAERATAFAGHPIVYAGFLIQTIPVFGLAALKFNISARWKKFILLVTLLSLIALILTGTRGAWIAMFFALTFYSAMMLRQDRKLFIIGIVLLLIGAIAFVNIPPLKHKAMSIVDLSNESNFERLVMWDSAWRMFKDHPLTGVGLGMYSEMDKLKYRSPLTKYGDVHMHAHSNFMNFLAETGLIGFTAFIALFGYLLKDLYQRFKNNPQDIWAFIGLLSIISFLIQGFTEYNFGHLLILRLLCLTIGISYAGSELAAQPPQEGVRP